MCAQTIFGRFAPDLQMTQLTLEHLLGCAPSAGGNTSQRSSALRRIRQRAAK
jgi:hypothetical protein